MIKIEAPSLQEAFSKAAEELECSVNDLDFKVIQHPSAGFFGFFKKNAIIEVNLEKGFEKHHKKFTKKKEVNDSKKAGSDFQKSACKQNENRQTCEPKENKTHKKDKKTKHKDTKFETTTKNSQDITDSAFANVQSQDELKQEYVIKRTDIPSVPKQHKKDFTQKNILDTSILDTFHKKQDESTQKESNEKVAVKQKIDFDKILPEIKQKLIELFKLSAFNIDTIEVSQYNDDTIFVKLDGDDVALLIGKKADRYKAISYLLYNWLNAKYKLNIRLEIAQFLQNQESAMDQYLSGVYERVLANGKAQTKPLDGVLIKIALEKLREKFPQKYVGIKSSNDGKFIIINDFYKK